MAGVNVTVGTSYHGTLESTDIDYVTLTNNNTTVTILNEGPGDIDFTTDGISNPAVGGNNTWRVPAGAAVTKRVSQQGDSPNHVFDATGQAASTTGSMLVQLIGASESVYTVSIFPQ